MNERIKRKSSRKKINFLCLYLFDYLDMARPKQRNLTPFLYNKIMFPGREWWSGKDEALTSPTYGMGIEVAREGHSGYNRV